MIIVIPTRHKGRFYRSRLEARWSVFFDSMGIQFRYEPERFKLTDGSTYLPDFYLPEYDWFCEVKPDIRALIRAPKAFLMARDLRLSVMVLDGEPDFKEYIGFQPYTEESKSVVFDGGIPFSLDVDAFRDCRGRRLWAEPAYNDASQANPIGTFSPRYMDSVETARGERFEAA